MNHPIVANVLVLLLSAIPATACAQAQGGKSPARDQVLGSAPRGASFRAAGQEYRIVLGVRAARTAGAAGATAGAVAADVPAADVLERKGPYDIYVERAGAPAVAASRAVAVNQRSGQFGIVTGTLTARVASAAEAEAAARSTGLVLDLVTQGNGTAFFHAPAGADVVAAAAALAVRPGVREVEIEVREAFAQAD